MPVRGKSENITSSEYDHHYSDSELSSIIDPYLKESDYNNDGCISYEEYMTIIDLDRKKYEQTKKYEGDFTVE